MMDKRILLTYRCENRFYFEWFETEDELHDFIDRKDISEIYDAVECFGVRDIELNR